MIYIYCFNYYYNIKINNVSYIKLCRQKCLFVLALSL